MKNILSIAFLLGFCFNISQAQVLKPVKWTFDSKHIEGNQYDLIFKAKIDDGWHIYSQYLESDDGPVKTSFEYESPTDLKKIGKNKEASPKKKEGFDDIFEMNVIKFGKSATFTQRVEVKDQSVPIKGYLEFMVCDAEKCLPPDEVDFEFNLPKPAAAITPTPAPKPEPKPTPTPPAPTTKPVPAKPAPTPTKPAPPTPPKTTTTTTTATEPTKTKETVVNHNHTSPTKQEEPKETKKEETKVEEKETEASTADPVLEEEDNDGQTGILEPVKWSVSTKKSGENEFEISYKAKIQDGWYIYSQYLESDDGPIKTSFNYEGDISNFEMLGKNEEISDHKVEGKDDVFKMLVTKYKKEVTFVQKLKAKDTSIPLKGYLEFMTCDKEKCLPPEEIAFSLDLNKGLTGFVLSAGALEEGNNNNAPSKKLITKGKGTPVEETFDITYKDDDCTGISTQKGNLSYIQTFIKGFLGGLIALLTPCVFPMIPLTVSYFLKGGKDKKKGFRDAIIYGLSIVILYTGMGTLITLIWGADALNAMAANAWFNLGLALLLVFFAISFFGYFEIALPTKWADKTDALADKGGLIGILAMAATLAIVSFSCTGPIIGVLLVDAVSQSNAGGFQLGPVVGMFGFSVALALPFALFAAFPSLLQSLPASGGWMDDLKVSLGFVELALALKFFAVFSLMMKSKLGGTILLPYEAFVGLWVLIALLWAFYWFNWFRFKHTPKLTKVPMVRIVFGVLCLGLAAYCLTGFKTTNEGFFKPNWLMSGMAPPAGHSYLKPTKCPHGIDCYDDYYVAKAEAKRTNKPLFIDFTGHSCENCRRNEENVWPLEAILSHLKNDMVVVSLYVDETEKLETPYKSSFDGRNRRKVGQKWADFQVVHMGSNSQPLYVMAHIDENDNAVFLNTPLGGLITDSNDFQEFLECGIKRDNEIRGK